MMQVSRRSRRGFIARAASIAGLAIAPSQSLLANSDTGQVLRECVGLRLHLTGMQSSDSGRVKVLSLEEYSDAATDQFTLRMRGRRGRRLPEGIYTANNWAGLPAFDVHIVPAGIDGRDREIYVASFALLN